MTPDTIKKEHYPTLKKAIHWVNKLHIKTKLQLHLFEQKIQQTIENITDNKQYLKEKISIHINESLFKLNTVYPNEPLEERIQNTIQKLAALGIKGFHLSENVYSNYKPILQHHFFHQYNVTTSIHSLNVKEEHNHFSYLIYGPVFPSISKINYLPKKEINELKKEISVIENNSGISIIGVGGITKNNFCQVLNTGFKGIAIRGCIWQNKNPFNALQEFIEKWEQHKNQ